MVLTNHFDLISFKHVYRERNQEAYMLSKEGANYCMGKWYIEDYAFDRSWGYYQNCSMKDLLHKMERDYNYIFYLCFLC